MTEHTNSLVTGGAVQAGRADELRDEMIGELRALGAIRTGAVAAAFRAVPRHLFVPEVTLEQAYAPEHAEVVKRDDNGVTLSSVSASRIQAFMLEQADTRPGMNVLEVGSGGYNAALMAELVGETGKVTTVDIDPDVIDRARRCLSTAGYEGVNTVVADGAEGAPEHAPFDRIVVTVEAAELTAAWLDQLAGSGRIVLPLRVRGLTRSVAFEREGEYLVGTDYQVCGFVPMQGSGARPEQLVVLHDDPGQEVGLRVEPGRLVDHERFRDVLSRPRADAWSGVQMARGAPYDDLDLWLATEQPGYALLATTRLARDRDLVAAWSPMGVSTLVDDVSASFAYLVMRPVDAERTIFELGAVGHGERAAEQAEWLSAEILSWAHHHGDNRAVFRAFPAGTSTAESLPGFRMDGRSVSMTVSWPTSAQPNQVR